MLKIKKAITPEGLVFDSLEAVNEWAAGYGGVPVRVVRRNGTIWRYMAGTGEPASSMTRAQPWGGHSLHLYE